MPRREASVATTGLGSRLRQVRELRGRSLSAVSTAAEISTAYLQKLEVGAVKHPSPNVLHQLSQALDIEYAELMRLAGYIVPSDQARAPNRGRNELRYALSSEELTDEEAQELAKFLDWYRDRHGR